ncbi:MAG: hypothetical protein R2747_10390 [Pyrinomonadaceae bacterium]
MSSNWFRGEGVDVVPAKAGTVDNDIGDGMYLTDQLEVAKQYARERSPNPDNQRVYKIAVSPGEMKVLDLTTDARWKKHMSFPMPPTDSSGKWSTPEDQLRNFPSSKLYKQHFENFIKANRINLNDYDAVMGFEYRSGGKQMCILFKNNQPSPMQGRLRLRFVPIGSVPTPSSPVGSLRFGGKIGPGLKIAGGTLAVMAVQFLLGWLLGKLIEKQQEESVKRQMDGLRPTIESAVKKDKQIALKFLVDGKNAFATVRIMVENQDAYMGGGLGYSPTAPAIKFDSLTITDADETTPKDKNDGEKHDRFLAPGAMLNQIFYKMSFPLSFTQQEVDLFRSYLREIAWFDEQLALGQAAQDIERLAQDKKDLIDRLNRALSN